MAVRASVDIVIEDRLCKSCGICIDLCPKDVLVAVPPFLKAAVADLAACTGCGLCQMLCPDWCISLEFRGDVSVSGHGPIHSHPLT